MLHMSHALHLELPRRPATPVVLGAAGLIAAVTLGGLFDTFDTGLPAVAAAVVAPTLAEARPVAASLPAPERLDHTVVNQHSTAHDSDLPGASIAAYDSSSEPEVVPAGAAPGAVRHTP